MKLSIITTIYKRANEIDFFFERIFQQKNKNFEVVVAVDTNAEGQMDLIEKWAKKYKTKMKIIYNTKRQGRTKAYMDAIEMADGEYVLFISTSDELKRYDGVGEIIQAIKKNKNPDVLEFPASFRGVTRWNPELRMRVMSGTQIASKPVYIAKTMPFTLNKIYRIKPMIDAIKEHSGVELNSRFSTEWMYSFLLNHAKTFATTNNRLVKTFVSKNSVSFNPMRLSNQTLRVVSRLQTTEGKYLEEMIYACLFNSAIFLPIFTIAHRNKVMFDKLYIEISKMFEKEFKKVLITNKYLLKNNKEAIWLSAIRTKTEIKKTVRDFK